MEIGSRGIVLLAWGKRGYGFAAFNLAVSLKHYCPLIPITLFCQRQTVSQLYDLSVFDNVIYTDEIITDPGRFKARLYNMLPYEYNLYLDVDAICTKSVEPLFDELISRGGSYYTFINDIYGIESPNVLPMMYWAYREDIWRHYNLDETHKLPATQSSIQFIKKCAESKAIFDLMQECFDNPIPLQNLRYQWGGSQPDELYLNVSLTKLRLAPHIGSGVIYWGNTISGRVADILSQHYFISFFGYRGNIKPAFTEYYDRILIKMCQQRGYNHNFKWRLIRADKHANAKSGLVPKGGAAMRAVRDIPEPQKQAAPEPVIMNMPQVIQQDKKGIVLFTSFFKSGNSRRDAELLQVLQNNINCQAITKIVNLGLRYDHEKVTNLDYARPTFNDFINESQRHGGEFNIIANADIYFDESISDITKLDWGKNIALALSRYDDKPREGKILFNYEYSQDTWVVKGPFKSIMDGGYPMGLPGVDNRFAFELKQAGYTVINPAFDIKTYHLHIINHRTYREKHRVHGDYLPLPVINWTDYLLPIADEKEIKPEPMPQGKLIIHQPGKVGDIIICLPIAKHYNDLGYHVEWLCPQEYHHLFNYVDYCKPILKADGLYDKTIDLSFGIIQTTQLHRWWMANRAMFRSFVECKYYIAGVPIEQLGNLVYNRNQEKEQELYNRLQLNDEPYILVHNNSDYGQKVEINSGIRIIEFKPVDGFSIFDWRLVVEKASELHLIDSSLVNYADRIETNAKRVYYITNKVPAKYDRTILLKQWETIDYKGELINLYHAEPASI